MDLALTRRYRSKTLKEYIGGERIKSEILKTLATGSFPQVMSFYGESGCGKTTMARLVTKEYLCLDRDLEHGACGECDYCRLMEEYIETGDTIDLPNVVYINSADDSRKQDLDGIIEEASMPTYDGAWRVYIFDEFHRSSHGQQNRLLNILEEPPGQVLFLFCTTEPEKIIETIRNRVQLAFTVRKPNIKQLGGLLARVCKQENIEFDMDGINMVCTASNFVIRQALMNLERVIKTEGNVKLESVELVLGTAVRGHYLDFFRLFMDGEVNKFEAVKLLTVIKAEMSMLDFVRGLTEMMRRAMQIRYQAKVEGLTELEIEGINEVFEKFTDDDMLYLLKFLLNMTGDIESNLMLLIFGGIRKPDTYTEGSIDEVEFGEMFVRAAMEGDKSVRASEERTHGLAEARKREEVSAEEFLEVANKSVDMDALFEDMFGGD